MHIPRDLIVAENDQTNTEIDLATHQATRGDRSHDRPTSLPMQEREGRDAIRAGIKEAETAGLSRSTLLAVLMSETLPRLVNAYGPANAALILARIARDIRTGAAPNTTRQ